MEEKGSGLIKNLQQDYMSNRWKREERWTLPFLRKTVGCLQLRTAEMRDHGKDVFFSFLH